MNKAIFGKKIGMTQIFNEDGTVVPVTVVAAGPCVVVRKKEMARDGYDAVQVGYGEIREKLVNKPVFGQFKKAGLKPMRYLRELKFNNCADYEIGQSINADIFEAGDVVDVNGVSKGKGFAGVIKRHNQHRGPMTHGSKYHRGPGSLGAGSSPSKVFKGKGLPGHKGQDNITVQNLKIVRVDSENNLLLVKGSIPGARGTLLCIRDAVKGQA